MTITELQIRIAEAEELIEQGNFAEAEVRCREVLSILSEYNEDAERWRDTLSLRTQALRFLSWSLRETGKYTEALEIAESILAGAKEADSKQDEAIAYRVIGYAHRARRNLPAVLEYFQRALNLSEEIGDRDLICRSLVEVGAVYCDELGDYPKALDLFQRALAIAEDLGINAQIASCLENIGVVYTKSGLYEKALEHCGKSLLVAQESGYVARAANMTCNIGGLHFYLGDYARALEFFMRSLAMFEEFGNKAQIALQLGNIGEIYSVATFDGYDPKKAEEYISKAIAQNEVLGIKPWDQYRALAEMYRHEQQWEKSDTFFRKYHQLEKESSNIEVKKRAEEIEREKEFAAHERKIAIAKAAAEAEIHATTSLLHKVLPQSVAARLIKGEKVADYFENVSILFADIVGFTPIAARMSAREVVAFLNYTFGAFDAIVKKHGCQKIKTIGDGYMAVAGAPIECNDHAERIARVALELMKDIHLPEQIKQYLPKDTVFHLRIGLHTGSVFAGVIGEEGFAYDIYSDAVNLASRMESHGEAGKIHVSKDFALLLRSRQKLSGSTPEFNIVERGDVEIKGKGMMRTYFLNSMLRSGA